MMLSIQDVKTTLTGEIHSHRLQAADFERQRNRVHDAVLEEAFSEGSRPGRKEYEVEPSFQQWFGRRGL
jgi:hypothetical protein